MKVKAYIWCSNPGEKQLSYAINDTAGMDTVGWYKVKEIEVEFEELTREETIPAAVKALEEEKMRILKESNEKIKHIDIALAQLLALEN